MSCSNVQYLKSIHWNVHINLNIFILATKMVNFKELRGLLGKSLVVQLLTKFSKLYITQASLSCSQEPSSGPCPKPDQSSRCSQF
jgi:hypothetical protein